MTKSIFISATLYSYRNKDLKSSAISLLENTHNDMFLVIIDQHPLDRSHWFKDYDNVHYRHVFWDHIYSPISYKESHVGKDKDLGQYSLFISDDTVVSKDWDLKCLELLSNNDNAVISGQGQSKVAQKDKYFLQRFDTPSADFTLAQYVDRNFLFGPNRILADLRFPSELKYYGEEEFMSLDLFTKGHDIYSAPTGTYQDLNVRTLENIYVAFSTEHFYNNFINTLYGRIDSEVFSNRPRSISDFISYHEIELEKLRPLPHQQDDVLYDPNVMEIQNAGGERFVATTKMII